MKFTPARCSARRSDGTACQRFPIKGGGVCATHGGRAPAVRAKAAVRLLEASDVAAGYLVRVIEDESLPADTRLRAATDLLNRAGLSGKERIEVELGPVKDKPLWEQIIPEILVSIPPEVPLSKGGPSALTATVVPPADSQAAHDAGQAARRSSDPLPPDWVSRQDGPRQRQGKKR